MAIIKCKMCGGDIELSADKSFGVCEFCGSTMTLPKVDDEQRAAAFDRGNHFRRIGDFDKALTVYESLVRDNEADAEAHWCCALCRFGIEYVKDPASGEYMPTCHRASFDSFLEDVDTKAAIEHADAVARRQYERDAQVIEEVRRGILTLSQNERPYDVFICYKETDDRGQRTIDSQRAQEIYYQLTDQGRRVFFARITLEDKAGQQYEPYIFAALNSAKVMIVVGTRREHLEAVWVKNEWSRFLAIMKRDRKKLLIPCYADMDPYDMPEQLSVLQSYDMTKIGFIQDLTRGISKVLDADKKPKPVVAAAVEQAGPSSNVKALLKRGYMALEDGGWGKADDFFEQVLNQDAECAEAYMGKVLAARKASSLERLVADQKSRHQVKPEKYTIQPEQSRAQKAVQRWSVTGYLMESTIKKYYNVEESYQSAVEYWTDARKREESGWSADKQLTRAFKYAKGSYKQELDGAYKDLMDFYDRKTAEAIANRDRDKADAEQRLAQALDDADKKVAELYDEAVKQREADYHSACEAQAEAEREEDLEKLKSTAERFVSLGDYKDSFERNESCIKKADEILEQKKQENRRIEKKERNIVLAILAVVILGAVGAAIIKMVILPSRQYREAEELLAAGDYDGAIAGFTELGSFKDAADRVLETRYAKAEAFFKAGNFDEAIGEFAALEELQYADAKDRVLEVKFAQAEGLLAAGSYEEAILAFTALKNYHGAADRARELRYNEAEELLAKGEMRKAAIAFGKASGYMDAAERSRELWRKFTVSLSVSNNTVGLKSNGTVVAEGSNLNGQCDVSGWTDIVAVSAGDCHTIGLKSDGTVIAVGSNDEGQCNVSEWTDIVAVSAGDMHTVGLKSDGTVVAVGDNHDGQCNVSGWTDIVAISAQSFHTVGIKSDGTVVAVGFNDYGQCNVSEWTNIVAVSADNYHTVGLKSDGTVVAVGDNHDGQCNVSEWTNIVAVYAGTFHTIGLKSDGSVVAVGHNRYGQCDVTRWTDIVAVSACTFYTVGLKSNGTVVAVGKIDDDNDVFDWRNIWVPKTLQGN